MSCLPVERLLRLKERTMMSFSRLLDHHEARVVDIERSLGLVWLIYLCVCYALALAIGPVPELLLASEFKSRTGLLICSCLFCGWY
ncbi:hypothetical protein BDZ89DRAFT_1069250 [Hymenopellis radicata]|nr:hypothetical protein BDZ89DRAFT_1069250 [Hymenopellis radicata]